MKAAVCHARDDLRFEDIDKPQIEDGKVLVKVKYTGICGSDIERVNGDASHFYPNVFGHEFSGVVEEIGNDVKSIAVGDRVAGIPLVPCMKCDDCQKGNYSLCKHYSFIGSRTFGSFAEYVLVPERNVIKIDDSISFENGALFEPATIALHGLFCNDFKGGGTVAILGTGTIGLFTLQLVKAFGALKVAVFDIQDEKLASAEKFGADLGINTKNDDFMDKAMKFTDNKGFDYVFETAGNTITMKMAFELAANKAHICFVGTPKKEMTFSVKEWENLNRKEFHLTGSWMSYSAPFPGKEWSLIAEYFRNGTLKFNDSFIFKKFPLSQAADAFKLYKIPGAIQGKILINSEQ